MGSMSGWKLGGRRRRMVGLAVGLADVDDDDAAAVGVVEVYEREMGWC